MASGGTGLRSAAGYVLRQTLYKVGAALAVWMLIAETVGGAAPAHLRDYADSLCSFGSALAGCLLTAVGILSALLERTLIVRMRESGHFDYLLTESLITILVMVAIALVSAWARVLPDGDALRTTMQWATGLALFGTLLLIAVGWKYQLVLRALRS